MSNRTRVTPEVARLASRIEDAYSSNRYVSWAAIAQFLVNRGYSFEETEAIMRSKWTRWAADQSTGMATVTDLEQWLDKSFKSRREEVREVRKLTGNTNTETDRQVTIVKELTNLIMGSYKVLHSLTLQRNSDPDEIELEDETARIYIAILAAFSKRDLNAARKNYLGLVPQKQDDFRACAPTAAAMIK